MDVHNLGIFSTIRALLFDSKKNRQDLTPTPRPPPPTHTHTHTHTPLYMPLFPRPQLHFMIFMILTVMNYVILI